MTDPAQNKKLGELEALLFIHGEPIGKKKIGTVLEISDAETDGLLAALESALLSDERGLHLVREGERVQLATKPDFGNILEQFVKSELSEELTPASLEALSIVAYFAPISRSRIEYLRGVNSIFTLRNLLLRGLVERSPDPAHQNAYLYRPSFDFLKHIGVKAKEELPDYQKYQALLTQFEANG